MSGDVEITMAGRRIAVTAGGSVATFDTIGDAIAYAQRRLERVAHIRELAMRCE